MGDERGRSMPSGKIFLGAAGLLFATYVIRGFALPLWVNPKVEAEDRAALAGDIAPAAALDPARVMGIIRAGGRPQFDKSDTCDHLCNVLLYSGAADAVVTAPSLDALANETQRWTIEKRDTSCVVTAGNGPANSRWEGLPDVWQAIRDRALLGECVVQSAGRLRDTGLVVGHEILGKQWSQQDDLTAYPELSGGRISVWRFDGRGRPMLLARETWRMPRRLTRFLHKTMNGSAVTPRIILARLPETGKTSPKSPDFQIGRFLQLDVTGLRSAEPAALRAALDRWLDQPYLDNWRVSHELGSRFESLVKEEAEPGDLERYVRIIRDPRMYHGTARSALKAFPDSVKRFREALFERIEQTPPASNDNFALDDILEDFPAGAFADPSPRMLFLLADRTRAARMDGLVVRLADGGPPIAPHLFHLFEDNLVPPPRHGAGGRDESGRDNRIAIAALRGLCRLGPSIPASYRRIEAAVEVDPEVKRWLFERKAGAVVRARLGRPLETIEPPRGSSESWLRDVRAQIDRADCGY